MDIFSYKCDFVRCNCRIFPRAKKKILSIQMLVSCNTHSEFFWNFSHILSNQCTTRSKNVFKKMVIVLEMIVLEHFWWKHNQGILGVENVMFASRRYIYQAQFCNLKYYFKYHFMCLFAWNFHLEFTYYNNEFFGCLEENRQSSVIDHFYKLHHAHSIKMILKFKCRLP